MPVVFVDRNGWAQHLTNNSWGSFLQEGYGTVVQTEVQAECYGSRCYRRRLLWLALLGKEDVAKAHFMRSVVSGTKFEEKADWSEFLLDERFRQVHKATEGSDCAGQLFEYKTDHMAAYDEIKLTWPAPRHELEHCSNLDQRAFELVHFCNVVFPYERGQDGLAPEFMDAHPSFKRLLPDGARSVSPWRRNKLPTLTCSSIIIMRMPATNEEEGESSNLGAIASMRPTKTIVRQLDGVELLQLIGMDIDEINYEAWPTHKLANKMAGNAFSAFAMLPALLAVLATVEPDAAWCAPVVEILDDGDGDADEVVEAVED